VPNQPVSTRSWGICESRGHSTSVGRTVLAARSRLLWLPLWQLSDSGIRFVLYARVFGPKERRMHGIAHFKRSPPVNELLTKFIGRTRTFPRRPRGRMPADCSERRPGTDDGLSHWRGSAARRVMSILCSCQRPGARQTARLRRAAGARVIGAPAGVSPQAAYSGEARAPKSIIQEGKKGFRNLMIVFMKIQAVTRFSREILTRRNRRVSRYNCRNKVTVEMRVTAESRPIPEAANTREWITK
jgi:hypothetical protein